MPTRILQIIPSLDRGGAEKQLVLLATHLPREQFEVHVCTLTRGGPLEEPLRSAGIPLHQIGKSWKFDPAAYWRLRRTIQQLAPEIVHTWIFAANSYGRQAALSAGVPHIVAGERCADHWKAWHELVIDRYLARHTDRIVTNSEGVRDFYVERGLPAEKFAIIPNAVLPPEPPPASRSEILAELKLPPDAKLIGAVGRLWPQKRYKDLIWATDLLKVIREDAHLLILGDGPERDLLLRYRRKLHLEDRVHLLGHRSDALRFVQHFDCLWLASGYEGQSNAVMEAMSLGIPVVITDIPGNRDLVIHGESGFLVPVGDRASLARYANMLLDDRELGERIGRAGQARMCEQFSLEQMIQRHVILYQELLEQGPAGRSTHARPLSPS